MFLMCGINLEKENNMGKSVEIKFKKLGHEQLTDAINSAEEFLGRMDDTIYCLKDKIKYIKMLESAFGDIDIKFVDQNFEKSIFASISKINLDKFEELDDKGDEFDFSTSDTIDKSECILIDHAKDVVWSICSKYSDLEPHERRNLIFDFSHMDILYSNRELSKKELKAKFFGLLNDLSIVKENAQYELEQCTQLAKYFRNVLPSFAKCEDDDKDHLLMKFTNKQFSNLSEKHTQINEILECERMNLYFSQIWHADLDLLQIMDRVLKQEEKNQGTSR